jgi:putative DNA primase/helicase
VVLVHHTGKDPTQGLRGHSSLVAALDAAVVVARKGDLRTWSVFKAKDSRDGAGHPFRLQEVLISPGVEGESVTSCVVLADQFAVVIKKTAVSQGANQKIALSQLRPLFEASNVFGIGDAALKRGSIDYELAIATVSQKLPGKPDRITTSARAAISGLVSRGVLGCQEGRLWLP